MDVRELGGKQLCVPEPRSEPIEHARGHEAVPAERAAMDVPDRPIAVVRDSIHRADRHERPLEGGHSVERHAGRKKLQHRIRPHLVPGAAQGQQPVEHATPGRSPEHQAENHSQRLQPLRQRRVEQMVRAGPDVDEDERPEVNDRKPVAVDRTLRGLRHVIIHDPQHRRGQKEGHRIVTIPPLDKRILDASENRIRVQQARRNLQVVRDVEHRHRDDRRDVEPDRNIQRLLVPDCQRPEKIDRKDHPDHDNRDVERPDQFGIFLAPRKSERQGDRRPHDDQLPAPEMELRQKI